MAGPPSPTESDRTLQARRNSLEQRNDRYTTPPGSGPSHDAQTLATGDSSVAKGLASPATNNLDTAPVRVSYHVFGPWKWEMASLGLATCLVIAMFAVPQHYEGKNNPEWGRAINLGTVLSLFVVVFRAALLVPLSSIIANAKWEWFASNKIRPLQHFQTFDHGSRSSWGSFLLLRTVARSPAPFIGALLLLASFATGPFVQQSLGTHPCPKEILGTAAELPYARHVPRTIMDRTLHGGMFGRWSEPEVESMILFSALSPGNSANQVRPTCATGNCTFPGGVPVGGEHRDSFSTIGFCRKCMDVGDFFVRSHSEDSTKPMNLTLPNGAQLSSDGCKPENYSRIFSVQSGPDLEWLGSAASPDFIRASQSSVANVTLLWAQRTRTNASNLWSDIMWPMCARENGAPRDSGRPMAAVCVLHLCLQTFIPSLRNNELTEDPVEEISLTPSGPRPLARTDTPRELGPEYTAVRTPCVVDGKLYTHSNISSAPGPQSTVALYELKPGSIGDFAYRNISAPDVCVYRHSFNFALTISQKLLKDIFRIECTDAAYLNARQCTSSSSGHGVQKWTDRLFLEGKATMGTVSDVIQSFAESMTGAYRSQWGAAKVLDDPASSIWQGVEPSMIKGKVWQDMECSNFDWRWVLLPALLTLATALLLAWTVLQTWSRRFDQPVWKESVLPLLFYHGRLESSDGTALGNEKVVAAEIAKDAKLLEVDEMESIAEQTPVTFRWPMRAQEEGSGQSTDAENGDISSSSSSRRLSAGEGLLRNFRRRARLDQSSLMAGDTDSDAQAHQ